MERLYTLEARRLTAAGSLCKVSEISLFSGFARSSSPLTETVFSWPGMGRMVYDAIAGRDYPVIMGGFLVSAIMVVIGGFITDIIYMYLDPRVVAE